MYLSNYDPQMAGWGSFRKKLKKAVKKVAKVANPVTYVAHSKKSLKKIEKKAKPFAGAALMAVPGIGVPLAATYQAARAVKLSKKAKDQAEAAQKAELQAQAEIQAEYQRQQELMTQGVNPAQKPNIAPLAIGGAALAALALLA